MISSTAPSLAPDLQIVSWPLPQVLARLRLHTDQPHARVIGSFQEHHVLLKVGAAERGYWSPHLDLELMPHGEETLVRAICCSNPGVWGKFLFLYVLSTLVSFVGIATLVPQYMLDKPLLGLGWLSLGVLMAAGTYLWHRAGLHHAARHALLLWSVLEAALDQTGLEAPDEMLAVISPLSVSSGPAQ